MLFAKPTPSAVTHRIMSRNGIDLLTHPKYHDLSNIQSGQANPEGYRMVEFPLINSLTALIVRGLGNGDLVMISRFVSILLSLGTIASLYWLIKQIANHRLALLSSLVLAVLPFAVFYSRVILPEPGVLLFSTLALASFTYFARKNDFKFLILSVLSLAVAFLLKPFVGFLAPTFLVIAWLFYDKFYLKPLFYLFPIISLIPLIGWRSWIQNFSQGIPASDWLFNSTGIRLKPAWFRWIFYERLTKLILGFTNLIFLLFNLFKKNKMLLVLSAWWLGIISYLIIIATGNVRHDYYQNLLLPVLAITLARGLILAQSFLKNKLKNSWISTALVSLIFLIGLGLSAYQIKDFYHVNHWEYQKAGQAADQLLPPDVKVIAPAMGDTMFLFQTRRQGWPIGFEINQKIDQGATHYVTTSYDAEAKKLEQIYKTVKKTEDYLILDLTSPKQEL